MVIVIGEILIDIFEAYERIGGAPFNFAFHLKKLGVPVRFFSRIGNDENGQKIKKFVRAHGFDDNDLQVDADCPTGTVTVRLDQSGIPAFTIHENAAYDFLDFGPIHTVVKTHPISLVYYGTLIQRTSKALQGLTDLLSKCSKRSHLYCDINLRPGCYSRKSIQHALTNSNILKLNDNELNEISSIFTSEGKVADIVAQLTDAYNIDMVLLTKGEKGSELFAGASHHAINVPPVKVVDTVGAGDAFAAMAAFGILNDWPDEKILAMASELAMRVCGIEGAIPGNDQFYQNLEIT